MSKLELGPVMTPAKEIHVNPRTIELSLSDKRFTWFCGAVTLASGAVSIGEGWRWFIDHAQGRGPYLDDVAGLVFAGLITVFGSYLTAGPWRNRENLAFRTAENLRLQSRSVKPDGV